MEENHTKDRVTTKNVSGLQAAEKLGGSDTDDHSVSKSTQKSVSEKSSELETESKEPHDVQSMDTETQNRLKAFLEVAGVKLSHVDARTFQDPEILRKLTNSVSNALDEAATALNRMRCKQQVTPDDEENEDTQKTQLIEETSTATTNTATTSAKNISNYPQPAAPVPKPDKNSMIRQNKQQQQLIAKQQQQQLHDVADLQALQHLLGQVGHEIHGNAEDGESLLSLACSEGDSTPLMEAASGGYADIVKLLIDHGANVNATSSVGNTALTYACCGGFEEVVKILLDRGAVVEHQNENGHTPLMEAASCGHVGVAKLLLEYGANINTHSNEFKESALTLACYKGHLSMVKFLLGAGADQDHKTDEMHTALMEACMDGHVEVARLLLDHGAQVNMPAESFESPLTLAACGGHFELAALLLSRGADLEEMNDEGYTPLMEAAREGHEDVVQLLVDHGANINAQTEETQETALTLACCGGFLEVAQYLVDHGADIELGASTPLMEAAQEGHIDIVKYLIGKGANIHAVTNTMDTCLTYAAANGHTAIVKLLLQCGAELEHESEGGRTPLMKAARAGHMETVQFLISQGGDSNRITMNNDHTVLSLACAGGHIGIVKYLLIQGADSGHVLKDNSTMLIEAARGGHSAVVSLLLQQPKFTAALKNQLAQHQQMQSRSVDQASSSIAGKRRARGSHLGTGGRGKKQQKSPVPQRKEEPNSRTTSESVKVMNDEGLLQANGHPVQPHPQQQQAPPLQQPILRHHITADIDMTPPKKSSNTGSSSGSLANHKDLDPSSIRPPLHPDELNEKISGSITWTSEDKLFEPSEFTVNPSYKFGGPANIGVPSAINPEAFFPMNVPAVPIQGGTFTVPNTSAGGSYLLPPIFAQSPVYSNQEHMEAYMKADEILRNHMMQLDYNKQQALMTALESLMQQSEAHRASIGIGGTEEGDSGTSCGTTTSVTTNPSITGGMLSSPVIKSTSSSETPSLTSASNSSINLSLSPFKADNDSPNVKIDVCSSSNTNTSDQANSSMGTTISTPKISECSSQSVTTPQWSFTDPSRMPQFSMGISTLAPSANSPEKQSPKSSHHPSPGKHLSHGEKQAFASRIASRLEQVKRSPTTGSQTGGNLTDYYNPSSTPARQFFNNIDGQPSAFHPPLIYNNSPSKFNFGSTSEQQQQGQVVNHRRTDSLTGSSSIVSGPCSPRSELEGSSPLPTTSSVYNDVSSSQALQSSSNVTPSSPTVTSSSASVTPMSTIVNLPLSIINPSSIVNPSSPIINPMSSIVNQSSAGIGAVTDLSQLPPVPLPNPQYLQPIYSPELVGLKHLTHRIPPSNITIPDIASAQHFDASGKSIPLTSSVWLDANFPLDIPPPSDLIPDHLQHMIPSGYSGHLLESDSLSSGEGELDDEDDELEDSLALHPDLSSLPPGSYELAINIDQQTDSNHDTALTLAAAGGHDDLVELLLERGADIEHRDKKGCTPIILAANAGHAMTVAILLEHNADLEAQTDRTKDTALSLACSSGRQEVVELLLAKGSNYEHRNVSDYTPLSLAASGGYVAIIKMLLKAGADINSRTGSKLGISPLMLAAMNGHTTTVKLLLDFGSDINAQIETNRNTALTLACFQGRHEVVNLLVERQANVEHRAKTGLTPLMEAASGGYHEVGLVLINKGADVNAAPVPSSRDTALTIAADKGHYKFVDLLLHCGALVDVRNKKGNSPLWLAANGGHLDVTRLLIDNKADVDSQDNRKVSCLMAAFRKGHYKVVRYLVEFVSQFPSDADLNRYINTLSDKELIKKCQRCMEVIIHAKERQAAEANKNASILLQELDQERQHEENRKAAIARKRARKKKQKEKKKAQEKESKTTSVTSKDVNEDLTNENNTSDKENIDKRQDDSPHEETASSGSGDGNNSGGQEKDKGRESPTTASRITDATHNKTTVSIDVTYTKASPSVEVIASKGISTSTTTTNSSTTVTRVTTTSVYPSRSTSQPIATNLLNTPSSSPRRGKKEEGWKEVGKRAKKISIPASKVGQVVGRNSSNLSLIKSYTGANIEIEKSSRQAPNRTLLIKGSHESIRQSQQCITALQRDPNCDLLQLLQVKMHSNSTVKSSLSAESIQSTNIDNSELSSWKTHLAGGKPANSSLSSKSKVHSSQSVPDTTVTSYTTTFNNNGTSSSSMGGGSLRKQMSGTLNMSRSASAIDKKGPVNVPVDTRTVRMSTSVTTVSISSSLYINHQNHTLSSSGANNMAKSGAVRQLFTSNASSHQATNTNSVTGTKMSASLSLHGSNSNKPPPHLGGSSGVVGNNVSMSSSWKQVVTSAPPSCSVNNNSKSTITSEEGNKPSAPAIIRPQQSTSRVPSVSSKSSFHSSNTITSSSAGSDNTQNVFEQILKTPSLFPEVTSQITQPKKYSDAVGKKQSSVSEGQQQVYPVKTATTTTVTTSSNHVSLINRAPGSKPIAMDQQIKSSSVHVQPQPHNLHDSINQQRRTSPWNEDTSTNDEFNVSGENISPGSSLGPIAPPIRSSKSSTNISPKNQSVPSPQRPLQTPPVTKSPLLGPAPPGLLPLPDKSAIHVFRPIHPEGSELPNIVPTQMPTPVRNSRPPLLATPPGFPSQLMQTKARSETGKRSPLPKRVHHVNPNSPFQGVVPADTTSENRSPTKSPLQQQQQQIQQQQSLGQILALNNNKGSSNFNPNAPSFVPMGIPQVAQTTSSILGNPPSNLKYSLPVAPPPISSSILGTAPPQLQTSVAASATGGTPGVVVSSSNNTGNSGSGPANNPQTMTPPIVMNSAPPAPPPPAPPPPPVIPPLMNAQPSLLGNPPFPLLVQPATGQNVPPPPPPQATPTNRPMFHGNQYDTNTPPTIAPPTIPPPPPPNIMPNQFSSHPNLPFMNPHDIISDQYTGGSGLPSAENPQVFGFSSGSFPMETIPTATRISGDGDPNGLPPWNHQFGGLRQSSVGLDEMGVVNMVGADGSDPDQMMFPHPMRGVASSESETFTVGGQLQTLIPPPSKDSPHSLHDINDTQTRSGISAFSVLPSGIGSKSSLWTFTPPSLGVSEDSGWTKPVEGISTSLLSYMSSDWPVITSSVSASTSGDLSDGMATAILPQDNLQTVLDKLGLGDYYHTFQENYIDRHALMLMSEKDFTEVGIPKGPRIKLLNALGRYTVGQNFKNEDEHGYNIDEDMASSSSTNIPSSSTLGTNTS